VWWRQCQRTSEAKRAPYYLKIVIDGAYKPLNWAYELLNGFKLSFLFFIEIYRLLVFDVSYFVTTFYIPKEKSHIGYSTGQNYQMVMQVTK
jgi:hypothetical protein